MVEICALRRGWRAGADVPRGADALSPPCTPRRGGVLGGPIERLRQRTLGGLMLGARLPLGLLLRRAAAPLSALLADPGIELGALLALG